MAILDIKTSNIGESGQVPKFIYINTNNSVAEVTAAGFLNGVVSQGIDLNDTDMALMVTQESPSALPISGLYSIQISGGVVTLTSIGGSTPAGAWDVGGNVLAAPSVFGSTNAENVLLQAGGFTFIEFVPGSTTMDLDAAFLSVDISDTAQMSATTLFTLDSNTELRLGGAFAPLVRLGNNSNPANVLNIASPHVLIPNLGASTTPDILYYNSGTGAVTFGAVPGGGADWLTSGGNSGAGLKLGTNTTDGWVQQVNSVTYVDLSTTSYDVTAPAVNITASTGEVIIFSTLSRTNLFAQGKVNIGSLGDSVEISCDLGTLLATGGSVTIDTAVLGAGVIAIGTTNALGLQLGNIACVTTMSFNGLNASGTGTLLVATASGTADFGSMSGDAGIHGNNVSVQAENGNLSLTSTGVGSQININGRTTGPAQINIGTLLTGSITLGAATVTGAWDFSTLTATGTGAISITTAAGAVTLQTGGGNLNLNSTAGGDVNLNSNGSTVITSNISTIINGGVLQIPGLPNTSQANYLAYDSGTGAVTYQTVASLGGAFWSTSGNALSAPGSTLGSTTAQPWDILYNNSAYLSLSGAGLVLTAPQVDLNATANNITISASSGQMILLSPNAQMNVSPSANVFTVGNAFAGNEFHVNSNAVIFSPNTFSMNTVSTLHLGSGAAMDLGSGSSISISAPTVNLNTAASTNETHIGNPLVGNILFLETADIQIPQNVAWTTQQSDWTAATLFGVTVTGAGAGFAVSSGGFANLAATTLSAFNYQGGLVIDGFGNLVLGASVGTVSVAATTNLALSGATISMTGVATVTGTVAVPTHTPPAGYNYLCIDGAGNIQQFAA